MKSVKTNKLYVFVKLETVRNDIINLKMIWFIRAIFISYHI
jgi:hypothetical protein